MKLMKIAGIILSGCMAAAALGSVTASAYTEYYTFGTFSYYYQNYYNGGVSQKRLVSTASGSVLVWSNYLKTTGGSTVYGSGSYSSKTTPYRPAKNISYGHTTFYEVTKNGVRQYLCYRDI